MIIAVSRPVLRVGVQMRPLLLTLLVLLLHCATILAGGASGPCLEDPEHDIGDSWECVLTATPKALPLAESLSSLAGAPDDTQVCR